VEYIDSFFNETFALNPFANMVTSTGGTPACDPSGQICNEITIEFEPADLLPTAGDLETLINISMQQPEVQALIDALALLPPENPYSTTTDVSNSVIAATIQGMGNEEEEEDEAFQMYLRGKTKKDRPNIFVRRRKKTREKKDRKSGQS
jgi:hypothetical protein